MRAADMRARYGNISGSSAATGLSTQHGEDDSKYAKPQQAVEPLAQEQEVHLLRKLFHIGWGVFFVMLRHSMMRRLTKYDRIIGLLLSAAVFFETARMHYPGFNRSETHAPHRSSADGDGGGGGEDCGAAAAAAAAAAAEAAAVVSGSCCC